MADSSRHRGWKYDHGNTRLEAFVDMLKIKREKERAGKPPEKISWETFNYD